MFSFSVDMCVLVSMCVHPENQEKKKDGFTPTLNALGVTLDSVPDSPRFSSGM